jgi:hypothetical protein
VVTVSGTTSPIYQWYSNNTNNTTTGTAISGETNSTYTPPSTTVELYITIALLPYLLEDVQQLNQTRQLHTG